MSGKRKSPVYKRTFKGWGIHAEQTVRFNFETKLYEVREGNRLINFHMEELDSLIITLLQVKQRAEEAIYGK